jgi:hypothetical protein
MNGQPPDEVMTGHMPRLDSGFMFYIAGDERIV